MLKWENGHAVFSCRGEDYTLADHPDEPKLFLMKDGAVVKTLRHAFTLEELSGCFLNGLMVAGDDGTGYSEDEFSRVLAEAAGSERDEMDFSYAAALYARRQIERGRIRHPEDDRQIWRRITDDFGFRPACVKEHYDWIRLPEPSRVYALPERPWNGEQETLVNSFFAELGIREMYAMDWQHECLAFSPEEKIPPGFHYHDPVRKCQVYFPSYYPDGDYFFFADPDWKYGLAGHPWLKELAVRGTELIRRFEENAGILGLRPRK